MKSKMLAVFMVVSMVLGGILGITSLWLNDDTQNYAPVDDNEVSYSSLKNFSSYEEMNDFITTQSSLSGNDYSIRNITGVSQNYYFRDGVLSAEGSADSDSSPPGASKDHSDTNVQVEGVDEGDIIKTDGKYAYIVSRNQTMVFIVDVYPAEDAKIVHTLKFDWTVREIYLNNGKLVVLGATLYYYCYDGLYWGERHSYEPETHVNVYDLTYKDSPILTRSTMLKGSYVASRMIGDYLYLIVNQYTNQIENEDDLPTVASNVYYADEYDYWYTLTSIISINVQDSSEDPNIQSILLGVSTHIYVSVNNIYLSYTKRMSWIEQIERRVDDVIVPMVPFETKNEISTAKISGESRYERLQNIDRIVGTYKEGLTEDEEDDYESEYEDRYVDFQNQLQKDMQKTMIHRIRVKDGWIQYQASGGVRGYVLNRFSMDEYNRYFRIATTSGSRWMWGSGENGLANHVFVCDMDIKIVGSVNDIAPGESIYSARFMGDRGYLVTFKKVDPFFVIDLSNPQHPKILGELKIPGYSNYLHPYDENHVIGIGKDAYDMGDFAWYQGVKLSLFDVTDVSNPKEKSKYIIGDRGTESLALSDPHAFLFSKNKNLLVIPIVLAEIDDSKYPDGASPSTSGEYTWCGAYVINVDEKNGFELQGKITHLDGSEDPEKNWYYRSSEKRIKRSFYIEDTMYTLSDYLLKASRMDNLNDINSVELRD
jgi:uncharacterized secreted protein with C-terminal beta-propeller domain